MTPLRPPLKPGVYEIGSYIITHTAGADREEEFRIFRDGIRASKRRILEHLRLPWSVELEVSMFFDAERKAKEIITKAKAHGVHEGLRSLLKATKKSDALKIGKSTSISKKDLVALKLNSEELGYRHHLLALEFLPSGVSRAETPRNLSEADSNGHEILTKEGKKHFSRINHIFEQRMQKHVHLLENDSEHHFFIFDVRDLRGDSYQFGSHVHYTSHLWNIDKESTFERLKERNFRPPSIHIRAEGFLGEEEASE